MPLPDLPLTRDQRRLLRQLDELWNWGDKALSGRPLPTTDFRLTILFQLTGATHRLVRGLIAQIRGGSVDGLEGTIRRMIEALITVKYILGEDSQDRAIAFIADDVRSRRSMCERILALMKKNKAPVMSLDTTEQDWRDHLHRLSAELKRLETVHAGKDLKWPSLEERARLSDTGELYATVYWLFSHTEHLTSRGLNKFMKERDGDIFFNLENDATTIDPFIRMACIYYVSFLNECSERTGYPEKKDLARFDSIATQWMQVANPRLPNPVPTLMLHDQSKTNTTARDSAP